MDVSTVMSINKIPLVPLEPVLLDFVTVAELITPFGSILSWTWLTPFSQSLWHKDQFCLEGHLVLQKPCPSTGTPEFSCLPPVGGKVMAHAAPFPGVTTLPISANRLP